MRKHSDVPVLLSGRHFTAQELFEVQETVRMFSNLSRYELTHTLCENLNWVTRRVDTSSALVCSFWRSLKAKAL